MTLNKQFNALISRVLLHKTLRANSTLSRLYQLTRKHSRTQPVQNMVNHIESVLGKMPRIKAKTQNPKYHASVQECMHIGLKDTQGISKHYYRYIVKLRSLNKQIAQLYRFVGLSHASFPVALDEPLTFTIELFPSRKRPLDSCAQYSFSACKVSRTENGHMLQEWIPRVSVVIH
jgi:hypothetical protein